MYYGTFAVDLTIGNNTYSTDSTWHLIPEKKPVVVPPTVGADGYTVSGSNSWAFVMPAGDRETYEVYQDILSKVDGKECTVTLHYSGTNKKLTKAYSGRVTITDFSTDDSWSVITFGVELTAAAEDTANAAVILAKYACSFTIGSTTKNTFSDWKLKATAVPVPEPAAVRTTYVEVPGLDGDVDLSEVLGNTIHYGNREGSWNFEIYDKKELSSAVTYFNAMISFLHGKHGSVTTPSGTYTGRFSVSGINIGADSAGISINYHIDP
jgi:hypothetical protein